MIKLSKLSFEELQELASTLNDIVSAGDTLESCGFEPSFDLTPGQEIIICTGSKMPCAGPMGALLYQGVDLGSDDATVITEYPDQAKPAQTGTGPQAPAGESAGGGDRDTAAPSDEGATPFYTHLRAHNSMLVEPVPGPAPSLAEAAPAVAEVEGEGTAPSIEKMPAKAPGAGDNTSAGELKTGPLTDDEKDDITRLAATGTSRQDIAKFLNRKIQTVALFLTIHEKKAVADAAAEPKAGLKPAAPDPRVSAVQISGPSFPTESAGVGRAEGRKVAAPAPSTASGNDGLAEHLKSLPRAKGWSLELDAELMRLACLGWNPNEIEADLDVQGAKARFELLTDSRSYPREKVAAKLASWLPPADKA